VSYRDILSSGSSRPWPEVIRIMTRGRTDKLDARPLLEYFKPLIMWLNVQNRDESLVGWSTTGEDTGISSSSDTVALIQSLGVFI
jgi:peptidyl-dipeptidase A